MLEAFAAVAHTVLVGILLDDDAALLDCCRRIATDFSSTKVVDITIRFFIIHKRSVDAGCAGLSGLPGIQIDASASGGDDIDGFLAGEYGGVDIDYVIGYVARRDVECNRCLCSFATEAELNGAIALGAQHDFLSTLRTEVDFLQHRP